MAERPLVAFTLLLQAAVGTAWAVGLLGLWLEARGQSAAAAALAGLGWPLTVGLAGLGLLASCAHLARPGRAWRALSQLRTSWLSREVLLAGTFAVAAAGAGLVRPGAPGAVLAWGAAWGLGLALVAGMARAYRLGSVPAWNSAGTPLAFLASTLLLGTLAGGAALAAGPGLPPDLARPVWTVLTLAAVLLAAGELAWTEWWLNRLPVSHRTALLEPGPALLRGRLALGALGLGAALLALAFPDQAAVRLGAAAALAGGEVLGRFLFYAGRVPHGVYRHPG